MTDKSIPTECPACGGGLRVVESGYSRYWSYDLIDGVLVMTEETGGDYYGAGDDHFECRTCLTTVPIPADVEMDYT